MRFWEFASTPSLLILGTVLGIMMILSEQISVLKKTRVPYSILAGIICLIGGQQIVGFITLDQSALEFVVYHGLAITFITIGLQEPKAGASSSNTVGMGMAIPFMAVLQGFVGLAVVVLLPLVVGGAIHPGLGLLLPLGFNQGPGQALSMGEAWASTGLVDGGQIGLIMAAIGFGWSILVGIPLVFWLKRKNAFSQHEDMSTNKTLTGSQQSVEHFSYSICWTCMVYLACYGILCLLNDLLDSKPNLQSMIWGFHYLIALVISVFVRKAHRWAFNKAIHRGCLQQLANISVDWVACAAIAAIQISVLKQNWLPIFVLSGIGLLLTLTVVLWWSSRGFTIEKGEHAIVWFGTSTGTLPMGLALLRMVDPKLQSSAPSSVAMGSMISLFASVPLLLLIMPYVINSYPDSHPQASTKTLGFLMVYALVLCFLWWRTTRFSLKNPTSLWVSRPEK